VIGFGIAPSHKSLDPLEAVPIEARRVMLDCLFAPVCRIAEEACPAVLGAPQRLEALAAENGDRCSRGNARRSDRKSKGKLGRRFSRLSRGRNQECAH